MKSKLTNKKTAEVVLYIIFGVLTTAVGMLTYFGILFLGEKALMISPDAPEFYAVRLAAQILHWVAAVLFAFFTNKKWVFTSADKETSTVRQLLVFSSGRLLTLGLDTAVTFATVWLLQALGYVAPTFMSVSITPDLISKISASVLVMIANYFISKIFVFKDKKA